MGLAASAAVQAQSQAIGSQPYPSRPVTIVVAYPPGGAADIVARVLGQKLGQRLGQPVLISNRGGAAGMIGAEYVAKSAPDGYTLLMGSLPEVVINPFLYKSDSYRPAEQLQPLSMVVTYPFLFVANPALPARSAQELIDLAKKQPNHYTYASSGKGSVQHIGTEMLTSMAGIQLQHIPYKGVGPALNDLLGNQVSMGLAGYPAAIEQVRAGKLTAIGISSKTRSPMAPDIPALAETPALKNYEFVAWIGLFAPAGTPRAIGEQLQREVTACLSMPDVRATMEKAAMTIDNRGSPDFAAFLKGETAKYSEVIRDAHIQVE
jgi:tripartite-type tricarboxylate transporter receptor subunit TctC